MVSQNISKEADTKVLITCIIVGVVFVVMRSGARLFKARKVPVAPEDLFIYLALVCFIVMCSLYLAAMPTLYNAEAVAEGLMLPYASLETDLVAMLKEFLAVQMFFWATLWAVKLSLLCMFKRLTIGLPLYTRIWWAILVFTALTFVGCVISGFTSCSSMHAWLTAGECYTHRDAVAKAASLWYSLAVDLVTDMMIMALPVRLLWNLQISTMEKFSLCVVFTVGIITMVFAIVRVVSLDASTSGGQVSTTWLILWGGIEGAVAIIVGCLPSFAIFIRGRVQASRIGNYNYGSSGRPRPSYPSNPSNSIQSSRSKARIRTESILLDEVEPMDDQGSKKSLVGVGEGRVDGKMDARILVQREWSQKWDTGTEEDRRRERERRLGVSTNVV